eukprot:CAMPEP_0174824042 /NCGR_PEP_ID=MMETSP1107-20130205/29998_1 /TAXON_ID=36770 /ORGANISM="Paraphysomonas vestita, Strain GFlagA" /LENGTH=318 /DNA_ID=CAMNT_0016049207 /DNA_START=112 /DNA_END=1065 /DNA_ORIENTATION=-
MNEIIIDDEPKVSRYASSDGHATEAPKECFDRHEDCDLFVSHGECIKNPGWMIINCPVGCKACHLRDSKIRCPRKALNISEESVLKPGTLNQIFQRIIQLSNENQIGKINVLSNDPWIIEFENFITPLEAKSIITAVHDWEKSTDTGEMNEYGEQGRILSTGRTSTNAWCRDDCESKPNVQRVLKRIEFVTTVPIDNYESFQVLKYDIGQYYRAHHDTGADEDNLACGMRILTFFLYLSDVEIGGETSFPLLNLSVKPKLGKAVLWPGVYSDNPSVVDYRTRHEAKPVIKGIKYGANSWIHSHNFKIPNLWGCTGSFD